MQRRLLGGAVLLLAALPLGCSGGVAAPADSPVSVSTSQLFVTLENVAGQPLTDMTVAIVPVGGQTEYTKYFGRIESDEKRNISLAEFLGRDGTKFDLRVVKPRMVNVKATDLTGKAYDVDLPWN
jgi:hypothetical protein